MERVVIAEYVQYENEETPVIVATPVQVALSEPVLKKEEEQYCGPCSLIFFCIFCMSFPPLALCVPCFPCDTREVYCIDSNDENT